MTADDVINNCYAPITERTGVLYFHHPAGGAENLSSNDVDSLTCTSTSEDILMMNPVSVVHQSDEYNISRSIPGTNRANALYNLSERCIPYLREYNESDGVEQEVLRQG